jgi:hypothetical protein
MSGILQLMHHFTYKSPMKKKSLMIYNDTLSSPLLLLNNRINSLVSYLLTVSLCTWNFESLSNCFNPLSIFVSLSLISCVVQIVRTVSLLKCNVLYSVSCVLCLCSTLDWLDIARTSFASLMIAQSLRVALIMCREAPPPCFSSKGLLADCQ